MKVAAFARWLDLQNRMSLKEVQAVLGSLKYSRTAPVDVVVFDHVLDHLQAKNKKWADERLVMIDMRPPPQPKKKVEAPAPAPPVEVRTYYEPPAQPRSPLLHPASPYRPSHARGTAAGRKHLSIVRLEPSGPSAPGCVSIPTEPGRPRRASDASQRGSC